MSVTNFTEHHTEKQDGKTVQVFSGEFENTDTQIEFKYILDIDPPEQILTYIAHNKNIPDEPGGYYQITWHKNGIMTDSIQ